MLRKIKKRDLDVRPTDRVSAVQIQLISFLKSEKSPLFVSWCRFPRLSDSSSNAVDKTSAFPAPLFVGFAVSLRHVSVQLGVQVALGLRHVRVQLIVQLLPRPPRPRRTPPLGDPRPTIGPRAKAPTGRPSLA